MTQEFTYWEEGDQFIGYLNEFPDYWTQGSDFEDLKDHLRDLYQELTGGEIPAVRRHGQLEVA